LLSHGEKITFGEQELEAVETPGHTAGRNLAVPVSTDLRILGC
jgi:hypothetical protein